VCIHGYIGINLGLYEYMYRERKREREIERERRQNLIEFHSREVHRGVIEFVTTDMKTNVLSLRQYVLSS